MISRFCVVAALLILGAPPARALDDLLYELAPAGSYELPTIDHVQEHRLLDADGARATLTDLASEQCALISFVYLSCTDSSGCPLALASIQRLDRALAERSDLADRVRLVTVSFDPERDKPQQMAGLRHHMKPETDWRFLTAESSKALEPVLVDYGQDVVPLFSADGKRLSVLRHVAKVFLVDGEGAIRNVYSSGFLDHRVLLRDVETLLLTGANDPHP